MQTREPIKDNLCFDFLSIQGLGDNALKRQKSPMEYQFSNTLAYTFREQHGHILDVLLKDHTTHKNIIWANEHYLDYGKYAYAATAHITPELITGDMSQLIMPRALKSLALQKQRTKAKAEVFTPLWIVKKQNDILEQDYLNDDLDTYIKRRWLEITCGEAPYMTTRYDMATGDIIPLAERVGFVDRKLTRINAHIHTKAHWRQWVKIAYQSSYGFEWNGDSLLLARENLLYTYRDYYIKKWKKEPTHGLLKEIATIISYNVFQMDGLSYSIPLSHKPPQDTSEQFLLFCEENKTHKRKKKNTPKTANTHTGKPVKIKNWHTKKMEFFHQDTEGN